MKITLTSGAVAVGLTSENINNAGLGGVAARYYRRARRGVRVYLHRNWNWIGYFARKFVHEVGRSYRRGRRKLERQVNMGMTRGGDRVSTGSYGSGRHSVDLEEPLMLDYA